MQHRQKYYTSNRPAFTLVEMMIVVTIIGVLLAIAVPNFIRTRESTRSKACMGNLRKIQWAKDAYLMDANLSRSVPASVFTDAVLYGPTQYIISKPLCPGSGTYDPGDGLSVPTCNYAGGNVHVYGE